MQWTAPYGYVAPTTGMAMPYLEYQQRYGACREHMATLAVQIRKNVQRIPQAYWYGHELTVDDYMNSRMISEPMCLFDNDIPVDGGGSFIITTAERAKDLPNKPVYVTDFGLQPPSGLAPGTISALDDIYDRARDVEAHLEPVGLEPVRCRGSSLRWLPAPFLVLDRDARFLQGRRGLAVHPGRTHRSRWRIPAAVGWR